MLINNVDREGYRVCEVKSERIDASNALEFRDAILSASEFVNIVIIDMSEVSFIDSSAIAALVHVHRTLKQQNKRLVMVGLSKKVLYILELAGLSDFFKIYPSFESFKDGISDGKCD